MTDFRGENDAPLSATAKTINPATARRVRPGQVLSRASSATFFLGDDRHDPVAWRRVVSWSVMGHLVSVLPTTTKKNDDFLLVGRDRCALNRPRQEERDSYVCPRVEVVPAADLIEVGVLRGPTWIGIIQWKRARDGRL